MPKSRLTRLPFYLVVGLCLLQIGWWMLFLNEDSRRTESRERQRLKALCSHALVALRAKITAESAGPDAAAKMLAVHYPELEIANEPGTLGVRVADVLPDAPHALAAKSVRPSHLALTTILEERQSKQRMFTAEGITFCLLILFGVFLLYAAMRNEMQIRRQHESFLAGATHELKTPLATLRLGLETLALDRADPERARLYLRQMAGQVDRLEMEIDNLLNAAAGRERSLKLVPGDLADDLREVANELAPRFQSGSIDLELHIADEEIQVHRDRGAIKLVIRNLIDNAIKYSPEHGTIHVDLGRRDRSAHLSVRDEGPGIDPADRERIFEKFFRADNRSTESRGGSGLGLFLSRRLALAHSGRLLLADTDAGHGGACFELRLPLAGDDGDQA